MPFYCHKDTFSSRILLEVHSLEETKALKDGVLKPICDSLKNIIRSKTEGEIQYDLNEINMLLAGIKRSLCLLKKADTDQLDNDEMVLAILSTLLMRSVETGNVTMHLLSFLLDS